MNNVFVNPLSLPLVLHTPSPSPSPSPSKEVLSAKNPSLEVLSETTSNPITGYVQTTRPTNANFNGSSYTVPVSGNYTVSIDTLYFILTPTAAGQRVITAALANGATIASAVWTSQASGRYSITTFSSSTLYLEKGQTITTSLANETGGDLHAAVQLTITLN